MAIQTQGHRVSVMPGFTPVDPSLIAFNPQAITSGALSAIQIAQQLQRKRAFDIQQAELAATRDARIAEELARSGIVTQTAPGVIGAANARNLSTVQIQPSATELAIAGNQAGLGDIQFREQMRPLTQDTLRMGIEAKNANAPYETDLLFGQTDKALQDLRLGSELAPLTNELAVAQTTQRIEELPGDKSLSDRIKKAQATKAEADAELAKATAEWTAKGRPRPSDPAAQQRNALQELRNVQMQIQALENSPVVNPNLDNQGMPVPLIQYQSQTRDASGNVIVDDPFFGSPTPRQLNQEAERRTRELKRLYDLRSSITSQITSPQSEASPAPAAPPPAQGQPIPVSTKAEFDSLPVGSQFIFNGRVGIKTK